MKDLIKNDHLNEDYDDDYNDDDNNAAVIICLIFLSLRISALQKLRGYDNVDDEIVEMRYEAHKAASATKFSLKQLLTSPELRKPLVIAVVLQVAQQWSGINAVCTH